MKRNSWWLLAVTSGVALAAGAANGPSAGQVNLKDAKGTNVGQVLLEQTPSGLILKGSVKGVPAGVHAFHFHQVGRCEAPFKTAGDHFNPKSRQHGMKADGGSHAGDLPNITVPPSGELIFELFAPGVTLGEGDSALLDNDGASLVLHAKADDYASQPAGNAGDRIACGVIQAK